MYIMYDRHDAYCGRNAFLKNVVRHMFSIYVFIAALVDGRYWKTTDHHELLFNETTIFRLKGLNWYGYEGQCQILGGLQVRPMDTFFDMFSKYKYNALRIPFGYETILTWDESPNWACLSLENQWLGQMSVRDTLHVVFQKAMEHHIVILLDFHTIAYEITQYPWSETITQNLILETWKKVIWEFSRYPNLLGVDIKNEPHGTITWPVWTKFIHMFIDTVNQQCPTFQGLFFIGGIEENESAWGGGFSSSTVALRNVLPDPLIVFSPHVYGVSVRGSVAENDGDTQFDMWFGFLLSKYKNPIVIGELGGWDVDHDNQWHNVIQKYLVRKNIRNIFYWCLNPDSKDTGGVLYSDWMTVDSTKIQFHNVIQPDPTVVFFHS